MESVILIASNPLSFCNRLVISFPAHKLRYKLRNNGCQNISHVDSSQRSAEAEPTLRRCHKMCTHVQGKGSDDDLYHWHSIQAVKECGRCEI